MHRCIRFAPLVLIAACNDPAPAVDASPPRGTATPTAPRAEDTKPPPPTAHPEAPPPALPIDDTPQAGALDPKPAADTPLVLVEARSPALGPRSKTTQIVGMESLPGRLATILPVDCEAPCWQSAMVWPATADDAGLDLKLYRGNGPSTRDATHLGTAHIEGIPTGKGRQEVQLGLGLVDGDLKAYARLVRGGTALPLTLR